MKTALRQAGYRRKSHFLHYHSTRFAYVYKVSTNGSTSYSRPNVIHGPKRYSAEEWSLAETMTHNAAESEQQSAGKLRRECIVKIYGGFISPFEGLTLYKPRNHVPYFVHISYHF